MFGPVKATPILRLDAGKDLEVAVAELHAVAGHLQISSRIQFSTGVMLFSFA